MESCYEDLVARGAIYQTTNEDKLRELIDSGNAVIYWGTDPTGKSAHVGHLLGLTTLARLQNAGNKIIVLLGGTTALIGDPSGKSTERILLSENEVESNRASLLRSIGQVIDMSENSSTIVTNNADWFNSMNVTTYLRDISKLFSVNELMKLETNKSRLNGGHGMSLTEFSYTTLQAYDWLHLFQQYGCNVQLGGSDQFGNITQGTGFVRSTLGANVYGMTTPLIKTASGEKMGKSVKGGIWLSPELTSPYDFYQSWMQIPDDSVEEMLKLYTFLSIDEIESLVTADIVRAKEKLAFEVTAFVHNHELATSAKETSKELFNGEQSSDSKSIPCLSLPKHELDKGIRVVDVLKDMKLTSSNSEGVRLIKQGGIYINGIQIDTNKTSAKFGLNDVVDSKIMVRIGKKRFARIDVN